MCDEASIKHRNKMKILHYYLKFFNMYSITFHNISCLKQQIHKNMKQDYMLTDEYNEATQ